MHLFKHYMAILVSALLCMPLLGQNKALLLTDDPYFRIPTIKAGEDPQQAIGSSIFLQVSASKSSVFAGEAFLVEYKLYRAITSDPTPEKQPAFNGCSVIELSPLTDSSTETIKGIKYHVNVLRKVQLTPLQDGPLLLDEASVNNTVQYVNQDAPSQLLSVDIEALSKPLTIEVKPLPEKDKPGNFAGVVGNYDIIAKTGNTSATAGENCRLTLVIKGTGDIADVMLPAIKWPANIEHFEGTTTQHIEHDTFPVGGDKTFDIPFIGSKEGKVTIPPVCFVFFNPLTQKYDSTYTDSLPIHFAKAVNKQTLHEIIANEMSSALYVWIVPVIALVAGFVIILSYVRGRKKPRSQARHALSAPVKSLPDAAINPQKKIDAAAEIKALSATTDLTKFYNKAKELLTIFIRQKLNTEALSEREVIQELADRKQDKAIIDSVQRIFKICNQNLYSPIVTDDQKGTVLELLTETLRLLEV